MEPNNPASVSSRKPVAAELANAERLDDILEKVLPAGCLLGPGEDRQLALEGRTQAPQEPVGEALAMMFQFADSPTVKNDLVPCGALPHCSADQTQGQRMAAHRGPDDVKHISWAHRAILVEQALCLPTNEHWQFV